DLGDAGPVEDAAGSAPPRVLRVAHQALPVDDEPGVQAADPPDPDDHLVADGRQELPEQALVAQAREDLTGVVRLAVVGRQETGDLARRVDRIAGPDAAAVEVRRRARQAADLAPDALDERAVVRHPLVGAAGLVDV